MKKIFTLLFACWALQNISAQSFSSPESVDYDAVRYRWIVGQNGSGQIHSYDPQNGLTGLVSSISSGPHGIECVGDTVFCCDGSFIRGYSLIDGTPVFNLNLGASFLNGLTWDGGNYLYTTDFSGKKIYRVDIANATFGLLATTVKTPNGIIYDGANNRCVFVCWGSNAAVQSISLADSSVTTLKNTSLGNFDGITRDLAGNWYVTAWTPGSLQLFDSAFTAAPVQVMSSLSSPADIDINAAGDSIGIPNSGAANNVVFYTIPGEQDTTDTSSQLGAPVYGDKMLALYPNPSADRITIVLQKPLTGIIRLRDGEGKILVEQKITGPVLFLDRGNLAAGIYFMEMLVTERPEPLIRRIIFAD